MSKSTKPKSNVEVAKSLLDGEEREYFIPSLGRSIKAVNQEDIEKKVKQARKPEAGDGDS